MALPSFDFETYSAAGFYFDPAAGASGLGRWRSTGSAQSAGLAAVGAAKYSEHETTIILCLAYDLKDGRGARLWVPGMGDPADLFSHILRGGLIEAFNSFFEFCLWNNNAVPKLGWPRLPLAQLRCAQSKARRFSLPAKLAKTAEVLKTPRQKIKDGDRLIKKFSVPRSPSKNNPALRIDPANDPVDGPKFYEYCVYDIYAEDDVSEACPDLSPGELNVWLVDQKINARGVYVDRVALDNCINIVRQATQKYNAELLELTDGAATAATELDKIKLWLAGRGLVVESLDKEHIKELLTRPLLPPDVRRVLEIRRALGSSSVKKLYAIDRMICADGRIKDLFAYCGADRTGRWAGWGPQPQNLPKAGPPVQRCEACGKHSQHGPKSCACCNGPVKPVEWSAAAVVDALGTIAGGELAEVEAVYGDAVTTVAGCLRGLFIAAPGREFICSDYSAIEAVVLAALAGEKWRLEVFKTHGKIYEKSASLITGIPFAEFMDYKKQHDDHHPMRNKIGKFAELASGFGGGLGAWLKFGAGAHMTDDQIKDAVKTWRRESPNIVKFWYGLQDAATLAIQRPGQAFAMRDITYQYVNDVLYCRLPSGRCLHYHAPRLHNDVTPWGKNVLKITYMGWNSDYTKGPVGWLRLDTYSGKLAENVTQACARDILADAMVKADRAGYDIALHVHDEILAEVDEGRGSVEELETIMQDTAPWCASWPIKAAGGWRGKRYRKD